MNDITIDDARRAIAGGMIDKLKDRLASHTRTQRLGLLRLALDETRRRALANPPPIAMDEAGKPKPAGPAEEAFGAVSDVLFDELAAILGS
jgi:hypothetical protein